MQRYWVGSGKRAREIWLPAANEEVLPGICWGRADIIDTAAYWALRCSNEESPLHGFLSQGNHLIDEIGFCILGGYGITAELNAAAFKRLKDAGVFNLDRAFSEDAIRALLLQPLEVNGRPQRYRFPNQRASRLACMRQTLVENDIEAVTQTSLARVLQQIRGIGPKTAAWIIRNHFDSDEVAILDIHVIRACSRLRLFPENFSLPRDYGEMEQRFISFARALKVRPAILDAVMWTEMRNEPRSQRLLAA